MPVQRLGNRQDFYDNYMEGCRHHEKSDHEACDQSEADRIHMNVIQPQSMVNYTTLGFTKVKTPAKVFKQIKKFWEDNKGTEEPEEWFTGNTYTNHVSIISIILSLYVSFFFITYNARLLFLQCNILIYYFSIFKLLQYNNN